MAINKVVYDGTTLIDLSSDTLSSADQLMQGIVAHDRTGAVITGTGSGGSGAISVVDTQDSHGGTIRTITAVDISDTTAVAGDVAQGKYFYTADGTKTAGTSQGGSAGEYDFFGAGTEYMGNVYSAEYNLSSDTSWDSWTPSTSASVILASSSAYVIDIPTADWDDYNYWLVGAIEVDYAYKSDSPTASRVEKSAQVEMVHYAKFPSQTISSWESETLDGNTTCTFGLKSESYYYNASGVMSAISQAYGAYVGSSMFTSASISSGVDGHIKIKRGQISARCNKTYFSTASASNVDSANSVIKYNVYAYKTPRPSLGDYLVGRFFDMLND